MLKACIWHFHYRRHFVWCLYMNRILNFLYNIEWLAKITGNRIFSVLYLLKLKAVPISLAKGVCGVNYFYFRKSDLSGLREILIDEEYDFLSHTIQNKETFTILDCGAHIGLPVLWAATINPSIKVLSVEASPDTFKVLAKNRENSKIDWNIINRACWSDETEISFQTHGDSMSHRVSMEGGVKVKGISLPDLLNMTGNENIDLIKIDIEGAEEKFLCSYPEALNRIDRMVIELHPKLCNTDKVQSTLEQYFPKIVAIQGRVSSKPLLYCIKE